MKKIIVILLSVLLLAACTVKTPPAEQPSEPDEVSSTTPEPEDVSSATPETQGEPDEVVEPTTAPVIVNEPELVFSATDQNGNAFTEAAFADKQLVLLNYWATWCGPCIQELPYLEKLYETYKDKGLLVVGVLVDGTVDDAASLISDNGITYPVIVAEGDLITMASGFMYVPTTVFVNANGERLGDEIIGSNSYEGWAEKVEALLP